MLDDVMADSKTRHRELTRDLLKFFYPMHYRIGMEIETIICQGKISRKQAAILWLIHSRAGNEGWVRRREIETRLSTWFEISNSNVSKLLRELAKPPLSLVEQSENPDSGREKVIRLTTQGRIFLEGMVEASVDYLDKQLSHVECDELAWGLGFLALSFRKGSRNSERDGAAEMLPSPPEGIVRKSRRVATDAD